MTFQETVNPEPEAEQVIASETLAEQPNEAQEVAHEEETMVPLHAVQKERRRRQEAELELKFYKEQQNKVAEPEDDSLYESATKEDLGKARSALKREIREENWTLANPEKFQRINDELPELLKLRPNLASAIESATNRYAEAWDLMTKLTPKQEKQLKAAATPKAIAPGSPSGVPKAAAMSENVSLMQMSDAEFNAWRNQQRGRK